MIKVREVNAIIDEAIAAMSVFDLGRLQDLERRITNLRGASLQGTPEGAEVLTSKKFVFGSILASTKAGLDVLAHLHGGETRNHWVL